MNPMKAASKFCLECEQLGRRERKRFCKALEGLAESDLPLFLELLFTDGETIRSLNREKRNVDRVTDVLSFPADNFEAGKSIRSAEHADCVEPKRGLRRARLYLGSVVICKERAEEQAEEYGHSYEREIFYLAVHGALHCLGYDHETEEEKAIMREKEEYVMQKLGLKRI